MKLFRYARSADDARVLAVIFGALVWPLATFYLDGRHFPQKLFYLYTIMAYAYAFLLMATIGAILGNAIYLALTQPRFQRFSNFFAAALGISFAIFMAYMLPRMMRDESSFLAYHHIPYDLSFPIVAQRYLIWLLPPIACSALILWRNLKNRND